MADRAAPSHDRWSGARLLVCPTCRTSLRSVDEQTLRCEEGHTFPLIGAIPVLLADGSAFRVEEVASGRGSYFERRATESARKAAWRRRLPAPGANRRDAAFRRALDAAVQALAADAGGRTLDGVVVGCGEQGARRVPTHPGIDWLLTDVDLHYGAQVVADGAQLPLADGSVDVVVAEHVLEHVLDIVATARELERVLRPGGLVAVTIPFSFPWHGVPFDFFRVTPSGARALFRGCEVGYLAAGMGNGSALGYGATSALTASAQRTTSRRLAYAMARLLAAPLKHLDRLETGDLTSSAFAAEVQLLGRRLDRRLTERELLDELRAEVR